MRRGRHSIPVLVVGGLAASAGALVLAPASMPDGYSWLSMTTSESAAQGVPGAWLARVGFALFGASVLLLCTARRRAWQPAAVVLHAAFGLLMIAAAGFSTRSWLPGAGYDRTEDLLHSVAASATGVAFAVGVVTVHVVARRSGGCRPAVLDAAAVAASVLIPLGMSALPAYDGVLQRAMFAVAYGWYAGEAVRARTGASSYSPTCRASARI